MSSFTFATLLLVLTVSGGLAALIWLSCKMAKANSVRISDIGTPETHRERLTEAQFVAMARAQVQAASLQQN